MKRLKKIIIFITVAVLLGIEIILVPFGNIVKAEENNIIENAQEITREEVQNFLGNIALASQGGAVKRTTETIKQVNDLGNILVENLLANGKRLSDVVIRQGEKLLFNPFQLRNVIGEAVDDFHDNYYSFVTPNRVILQTNYSIPHYNLTGKHNSIQMYDKNFPDIDLNEFRIIEFHGNFSQTFAFEIAHTMSGRDLYQYFRYSEVLESSTNNVVGVNGNFRIIKKYDGTSFTMKNENNINMSTLFSITVARGTTRREEDADIPYNDVKRIIFYRDDTMTDVSALVPNERPPIDVIEQNYSSTFAGVQDSEWISYNSSSFVDNTQIINNEYITNYETTTYEGDTINEGDTIIHEPDEEGGGSFWGALLDLISTFISTIGGLLESVINAIGNIVPSIIDFFNNALIPRESYFKDNFTEIQTKAEEKAPDFEPVRQVLGAFETTDQPSTWDGIQVNIPAFGINNITIVDPIMIDRYGRQIKTWVRMILLLMTSLVLIKRVSQVMGK